MLLLVASDGIGEIDVWVIPTGPEQRLDHLSSKIIKKAMVIRNTKCCRVNHVDLCRGTADLCGSQLRYFLERYLVPAIPLVLCPTDSVALALQTYYSQHGYAVRCCVVQFCVGR